MQIVFLATIFRRYLNIGILAHFCLAGSDVSVQVSSNWGKYLGDTNNVSRLQMKGFVGVLGNLR